MIRLNKLLKPLLLVCLLVLPASVWAASVELKWKTNNERDLSHYNVYYGKSPRNYGNPIPVGKKSSFRIDGLEKNKTYYFAITAVDTAGNESGFSSEIKAVAH